MKRLSGAVMLISIVLVIVGITACDSTSSSEQETDDPVIGEFTVMEKYYVEDNERGSREFFVVLEIDGKVDHTRTMGDFYFSVEVGKSYTYCGWVNSVGFDPDYPNLDCGE